MSEPETPAGDDLDAAFHGGGGDPAPDPTAVTRISAATAPGLPHGLQFRLRVVSGPDAGKELVIRRTAVVLGGDGADLALSDPSLRQRHCVVEISEAEVRIRDLGGGLRVNGEALDEVALAHRDRVELGSTGLEFRVESARTTAAVTGAGNAAVSAADVDTHPSGIPAPAGDAAATVLDGTPHAPRMGVVRNDTALFLEVLSGPDAGRVFDLREPRLYRIGRGRGDISLHDPKCSGRHAEIQILAQGEYYLVDLGSTNGTYLNGVRTSRRRLTQEDRIRIGGTEMRFTCREATIPVTEETG